jgi:hypothetical protein
VSCGLHDVMGFEQLGRPGVLVASDVFVQAADVQAQRLGQPALRRVFVPHPVQDRTDEELREMARGAIDGVIAALHGDGNHAMGTPPAE